MRRDADFFEGRELELVHVSRRLREALRVEDLFSAAGIDYAVEADRYRARVLFVVPVERVGAFFYVPQDTAATSRELLARKGFQVSEAEE